MDMEKAYKEQKELYQKLSEVSKNDYSSINELDRLWNKIMLLEDSFKAETVNEVTVNSKLSLRPYIKLAKIYGYFCTSSNSIFPPSKFDLQSFHSCFIQGYCIINNIYYNVRSRS